MLVFTGPCIDRWRETRVIVLRRQWRVFKLPALCTNIILSYGLIKTEL